MPSDRVTVRRVASFTTKQPGLTQFLIDAETDDRLVQYVTLDPFKASLLSRAEALHRPATVTWKDGRYGKDVVYVEILKEAV